MSSTNTALAYEPSCAELVFAAPAPSARPRPVSSKEAAEDESAMVDWFADLTWRQVLPIATIVMTLITGLMCCSLVALGA